MEKWERTRALRATINEAIEPLRREKIIGSSLAAEVSLPVDMEPIPDGMDEIAIVAAIVPGAADLKVTPTAHHKCGRCWRHLPEVTEDGDLCSRCDNVVAGMEASA
jgi:isoleucyl-tRNA synthetase